MKRMELISQGIEVKSLPKKKAKTSIISFLTITQNDFPVKDEDNNETNIKLVFRKKLGFKIYERISENLKEYEVENAPKVSLKFSKELEYKIFQLSKNLNDYKSKTMKCLELLLNTMDEKEINEYSIRQIFNNLSTI